MTVGGKVCYQAFGFILADVRSEEMLAVQISMIDNIVIEDVEPSGPLAAKSFRHLAPDSAGSDEHGRGELEGPLIKTSDEFLAVRDCEPLVWSLECFRLDRFHEDGRDDRRVW